MLEVVSPYPTHPVNPGPAFFALTKMPRISDLSEREASEPRIIRYNIGWVLSIVICKFV